MARPEGVRSALAANLACQGEGASTLWSEGNLDRFLGNQVILAIFGVLIAVGLPILIALFEGKEFSYLVYTGYALLSSITAWGAGLVLVKISLPPAEYAISELAFCSDSEVIIKTGKEILSLVNAFLEIPQKKNAKKLITELEILASNEDTQVIKESWRKKFNIGVAKNIIIDLERYLDVLVIRYKSVLRLKESAADQLAIPRDEFCDRVLRFSPDLFLERVKKYVENLNFLVSLDEGELVSDDSRTYVAGLINQNSQILSSAMNNKSHLDTLLEHKELHVYVQGMASQLSASRALRQYAKAISKMADTSKIPGNKVNYNSITRKLIFLYRQQQSYPGFPIHPLLENFAKRSRLMIVPDDWRAERKTDHRLDFNALQIIRKLSDLEEHTHPIKRGELNIKLSADQIGDLSKLWQEILAAGNRAKNDLESQFAEKYLEWTKDVSGRVFIVTAGYSVAVRQVIKKGLDIASKTDQQPFKEPYIYILLDEESSRIATKSMVVEIDEPKWESKSTFRSYKDIATGDTFSFSNMLSGNDCVIYLSGAECVDIDRRVVHPKNHLQHLKILQKGIRKQHPKFVCVACIEDFKKFSEPAVELEVYSVRYGKVIVFAPNEFEIILTGSSGLRKGSIDDRGTGPSDDNPQDAASQ